ncbi:unnamed protein product [Polarella glacialis]|uniref:Uncharacterized protein n=1 Tax=Polarella glacialis TaxID=89957 RepID=A0A813EQQ3_POLGL|nr:unnamed protein product [Polarella glacialis]
MLFRQLRLPVGGHLWGLLSRHAGCSNTAAHFDPGMDGGVDILGGSCKHTSHESSCWDFVDKLRSCASLKTLDHRRERLGKLLRRLVWPAEYNLSAFGQEYVLPLRRQDVIALSIGFLPQQQRISNMR